MKSPDSLRQGVLKSIKRDGERVKARLRTEFTGSVRGGGTASVPNNQGLDRHRLPARALLSLLQTLAHDSG